MWGDKQKLRQLADNALKVSKPVPAHQLAILATLLWNLDARSEGLGLLREAIRRRPADFRLNWAMALAYWRDGKFKESVAYFRIVITLRPENPWTFSHLGCALLLADELDEAILVLRQACKLDPNNEVLRNNLTTALLKAKRADEVLVAGKKLLNAEPITAQVAFNQGVSVAVAGRDEEAIPLFRKALALNPKHILANYNLGVALRKTGRPEQALAPSEKWSNWIHSTPWRIMRWA